MNNLEAVIAIAGLTDATIPDTVGAPEITERVLDRAQASLDALAGEEPLGGWLLAVTARVTIERLRLDPRPLPSPQPDGAEGLLDADTSRMAEPMAPPEDPFSWPERASRGEDLARSARPASGNSEPGTSREAPSPPKA